MSTVEATMEAARPATLAMEPPVAEEPRTFANPLVLALASSLQEAGAVCTLGVAEMADTEDIRKARMARLASTVRTATTMAAAGAPWKDQACPTRRTAICSPTAARTGWAALAALTTMACSEVAVEEVTSAAPAASALAQAAGPLSPRILPFPIITA